MHCFCEHSADQGPAYKKNFKSGVRFLQTFCILSKQEWLQWMAGTCWHIQNQLQKHIFEKKKKKKQNPKNKVHAILLYNVIHSRILSTIQSVHDRTTSFIFKSLYPIFVTSLISTIYKPFLMSHAKQEDLNKL